MGQTIFPALRYTDAKAAINWLCTAFGFERHAVYESGDAIEHAELRLGDSILMLGSKRETSGFQIRTPSEANGVTTTLYVCVADADAQHDRAARAGAKIIRPLTDTDYGSREFSCLDPEGHVWSFGTYVPHAPAPA